ncbi:MAG: hypothetical protein U9R72_00930, partial [Chloroflexota bacterium]|nr:hypothetical protein [Chloroflexota bacterium]
MSKNTIDELNALTDELTDVLEGAVEEALPLVEQEDTDLRDLEKATRAVMMRVGRRFLELLVEGSRPDEKEETVPCRCGGTAEFERY